MILDRIKEYLDYKGLSISAFEKSLGMSNASFGKSLKNNKSIGTDKLENILNTYTDINVIWLLTGKGNMIIGHKKSDSIDYVNEDQAEYSTKKSGTKYYNRNFELGIDISQEPDEIINMKMFSSADFICNSNGESMSPKIKDNDMIALKEIGIKDVIFGNIYAIEMDNFNIIRIIRKGDKENMLKFVPTNSYFDEQEFEITRIKKIYSITGTIHKF